MLIDLLRGLAKGLSKATPVRASLNGNSCRTHACFARQSGTCGEADSALNIANLGLAKLDKAQNVLSYRELLGLAEFEAWDLEEGSYSARKSFRPKGCRCDLSMDPASGGVASAV